MAQTSTSFFTRSSAQNIKSSDVFTKSYGILQQGSQGQISTDLIKDGIKGLFGGSDLRAKAKVFRFNAKQVELAGLQSGIDILEQFNAAQASNIVAAFASGIQLSGSVTRAQQILGRKAAFTAKINSTNTRIRKESLLQEARRLRAEAKYGERIGIFKIILGAGIKYASGGTV